MNESFRRILAQKDMRTVRSTVDFCYFCGKPLPPRGPEYKERVTGEHVIPRNLLGPPPETGAWAIELDVHRECENQGKQANDGLLSLLQKMNVTPVDDWPAPGHLRNLEFKPVVFMVNRSLGVPAFGNAQNVLSGAWTWIRGIHAALYAAFLPADVNNFVLPPVPACSTSGGITMRDSETISSVSRSAVVLAIQLGKWDGIDAWGGQLKYRCTWMFVPEEHGGPKAACCWALTFPGIPEWSRTVMPAGLERPWHGCYYCDAVPEGAAQLRPQDLRQ